MKKFPLFHKIIATAGGAGYFPYGPGTMGAIVAILLWLPLFIYAEDVTCAAVTGAAVVLFTVLGVWSSSVAERFWGEDPSKVVIDEVVGMWIALLAVPPETGWWAVVAAFVLFRFFDMAKPLGVRKMENFKKGYGIMADDVLAGIYSAIVLMIANSFLK